MITTHPDILLDYFIRGGSTLVAEECGVSQREAKKKIQSLLKALDIPYDDSEKGRKRLGDRLYALV